MLTYICRSILIYCLLCLGVVDAVGQKVGRASPKELARAGEVITGYLEEHNAPGAIVGVFSGGALVHTLTYGLANVELRVPVTDSTVFETGSISKQFIAVAALQLVEEGRLKLEDTVHAYLPMLPGEWQGVTISQLLNHTSGIPDYEEIAGYDIYQQRLTSDEIVRIAHSRPMRFKAGTGWQYSNTGYCVLSMVLEHIEQKPLGEVLAARMFDPLGMDQTRMADPEAIVPHRASGYWIDGKGQLINRPAIQTSSTLGAGGIVSSVHDMAKWDAALYGDKLLPSRAKAIMWTAVELPDGTPTTWSWGDEVKYGMGWEVSPYRGSPLQTHSGQTAGFVAQYMRFPEQGISIVAFINLYDMGAWPAARAMADFVVPGLK